MFSHWHKLQRFEAGLKGAACFIIYNISVLQMPDMLAEFCTESLVWVSERRLMIRVSGLKRVFNKAYIALSWPVVLRCHRGLVDPG